MRDLIVEYANEVGLLILGAMIGCVYAAWRQLKLEEREAEAFADVDHGLVILADSLNQFAIKLESILADVKLGNVERGNDVEIDPNAGKYLRLRWALRQLREEISEVIPD